MLCTLLLKRMQEQKPTHTSIITLRLGPEFVSVSKASAVDKTLARSSASAVIINREISITWSRLHR